MSDTDRDYLENGMRIAIMHARECQKIDAALSNKRQALENRISSSEDILLRHKKRLPEPRARLRPVVTETPANAKSWSEIVSEAEATVVGTVSFSELLTDSEIEQVLHDHREIEKDLGWLKSFDRYDFALAVSAGILSALIDIFLVKVPAHTGFLGSEGSEGGWLSRKVSDLFGEILPKERIKALEEMYNVSFDPASNLGLDIEIEGLSPRTHRYQSLGHDPILGFIFGVKDLLTGQFTAIDKFGRIIVQQTTSPLEGDWFIIRLFEALKQVAGHLLSDVATPAGLPAPLMPLLSFLQFGKIGDREYTIAELSRMMYRSGYDFRHFIAASIPVAISEFIVRAGYTIRKLLDGASLKDAIPSASDPRLRRRLLVAHGVAGLVNAGKVALTHNPLGLSWPLVLTILRYALPEVGYLMYGCEGERIRRVEKMIDQGYGSLHQQLDELLREMPVIKA